MWAFVLNSYEVEIPENREMYGVVANGNELYCWEAEMKGLFYSKEEAIEAIISEISKKEVDLEDLEEYKNQLKILDSICDFDFTYWDIIKVKVE